MFAKKSAAEINAMTETEQNAYMEAKAIHEQEQTKAQIEEALKDTKETVTAQKATIEKLEDTVKTQGEKLLEMTKSNGQEKLKTLEDIFTEKYEENVVRTADDARVNTSFRIDTSKAQLSTDVMSVDAVNSTAFPTAGSSSVMTTGLRTLYGKIIGYFGPRIPQSFILDLADVQPMDNATLIAINETTIGTAAVTPECTLKPVVRMTFAPQEVSADPVAVQWHTTTKLRKFYRSLVMRMEQRFAELVNKAVPEVVLTSIRANASAFTAVPALAINDNPNNYDALGAVIAYLETLSYMPNAIMLNPIAWRNMKQEKNADGIYTLSNGQSIALVENGLDWGGNVIRYIKDPKLGVDEFIIGDIYETVKVGIDSTMEYFETDGRTDAQATTSLTGLSRNIRTHVMEKFVAVIIPTGSKAGLIRDTFANVKTLITAP